MTVQELGERYGLDPKFIYALISQESGWKPKIANPYGSAKGLIQFTNGTAQWLGYLDSQDLIDKNPTVDSQLSGPVVQYWDHYAPYANEIELAGANFYPSYRKTPDKVLPPEVLKANPGYTTVRDYYNKILTRMPKDSTLEKSDFFFSEDDNSSLIIVTFSVIALAMVVFAKKRKRKS